MPQAIYDYHYGKEAEQYAFFRIPKVLMTQPQFKKVSTDAKPLYGLLLDRMSLSVKNGWQMRMGVFTSTSRWRRSASSWAVRQTRR